MTKQVRFEVGDVVHWDGCGDYTVTADHVSGFAGHVQLAGRYAVHQDELKLIRRASESQREGGFAVGQMVRLRGGSGRGAAIAAFEVHPERGLCALFIGDPFPHRVAGLEPADPTTALDLMNGGSQVAPPQPAPMTRAARVLARIEKDPYDQQLYRDGKRPSQDMQRYATDEQAGQKEARLRMARMTVDLDRPNAFDSRSVLQLAHPREHWSGRRGGRR